MSYWEERKHYNYYQRLQEILDYQFGQSILDVGSNETPLVTCGFFHTRVAVNLDPIPESSMSRDVSYWIGNFMRYPVEKKFDVVTCFQVLEHLDDDVVEDFTRKLFHHTNRMLLISVPYKWAKGSCSEHKQDPVDEEKLLKWTGESPVFCQVVRDGTRDRMICAYKNFD